MNTSKLVNHITEEQSTSLRQLPSQFPAGESLPSSKKRKKNQISQTLPLNSNELDLKKLKSQDTDTHQDPIEVKLNKRDLKDNEESLIKKKVLRNQRSSNRKDQLSPSSRANVSTISNSQPSTSPNNNSPEKDGESYLQIKHKNNSSIKTSLVAFTPKPLNPEDKSTSVTVQLRNQSSNLRGSHQDTIPSLQAQVGECANLSDERKHKSHPFSPHPLPSRSGRSRGFSHSQTNISNISNFSSNVH